MPHDYFTNQAVQSKVLLKTNRNSSSIKSGPCFLDQTMKSSTNKIKTIHKNVGSSVEFRCDSGGNPQPSYKWFSGNTIADWIVENARRPFLKIDNLRREYTGHYTCRVSNKIGEISFTFALVVKGK